MNRMVWTRRGLIAGAAALALAAKEALAQVAPIKLMGSAGPFFKERSKVAVSSYSVTFIIQQQATAAATIGVRSRLNTVLAGVDEATFKRLTNEAYADFCDQLKAAGFDVLDAEAAKAVLAGAELLPGNRDVKAVQPGVTIGKSVKKGWASFGADAAPIVKALHNPSAAAGGPMAGFGAMGAAGVAGKLGQNAKAQDAVLIVPSLTFDYINMEASAGSGLTGAFARADGKPVFHLDMASGCSFIGAGKAGPGYMQGVHLSKNVESKVAFAEVKEGAAGVRELSFVDAFATGKASRGDAVVVDLPVWEGLVREHAKAFNAALVAFAVKARGR